MFHSRVDVTSAVLVPIHVVCEEKSPKTCTGLERSNYIALCGESATTEAAVTSVMFIII